MPPEMGLAAEADPGGVLGKIEDVSARTVWRNEATDFTPWLLQHPEVLSGVLGIDLELVAAEHQVGNYALDLIGRDLTNQVVLIVENQLERSDHDHLGKLLTYAAGTDASTIVWITTDFRDEHRQALDWLNQRTDETTHFFAIELQLVRIDDSRPAPLLRLAAKPNYWQKAVKTSASAQLGGHNQVYQEFWAKYLERQRRERPDWTRWAGPPKYNELSMSAKRPGCSFKAAFNGAGRLRHELYIDLPTSEASRELFEALHQVKDQFEEQYGRALVWDSDPSRRACRIIDEREGDPSRTGDHENYLDFLFDAGDRVRRALKAVG